MMFTAFPELDLTEFEKQFVSHYKDDKKPGVLNRIYRRSLFSQAVPEQNMPLVQTSQQIQISRRARVYGLTFSGNLDRWRLNISNASGTQYTQKTPRTNRPPVVSSLFAGSYGSGASMGGLTPPIPPTNDASAEINNSSGPSFNFINSMVTTFQSTPLIIEPNWLLMPNETLIFEGTPIEISFTFGEGETLNPPLVLNIGIYVWEFPGMDAAGLNPTGR